MSRLLTYPVSLQDKGVVCMRIHFRQIQQHKFDGKDHNEGDLNAMLMRLFWPYLIV